jgi:hypothetical protein
MRSALAAADPHDAVKSPRFACRIGSSSAKLHAACDWEAEFMKRSRRVVLTLMGSAAVSAVASPLAARPIYCGPGLTAVPGPNGEPYCRAIAGGFGGSFHHFGGGGHGHGGHGHAGG